MFIRSAYPHSVLDLTANLPVNLSKCDTLYPDTYIYEKSETYFDEEGYIRAKGTEGIHTYRTDYFNKVLTSSTELFTIYFNPINITWYYESESDRDAEYESILNSFTTYPTPLSF